MSPSLTSGFSGSGDCSGSKSTETCSLLSVASYSSATPTSHAQSAKEGGGTQVQSSGDRRHLVQCEVCHLPFPSRAVLEHHLMGSRHARKVKAESVLRQLQVSVTLSKHSLSDKIFGFTCRKTRVTCYTMVQI